MANPKKRSAAPSGTKRSKHTVAHPSASKAKAARPIKTTAAFRRPAHPGGLGRGLDALIGRAKLPQEELEPISAEGGGGGPGPAGRRVFSVALSMIHASPWQPRRVFDDEALQELADSIRTHGIIQPLICRSSPEGGYELIGGERRMRAAMEVGLKEVPVIVLEAVDRDAAEMALIENLQREDLNVVEEAEGYRSLADGFGLTQADIAERVGKARASVANTLRLLELPDEVKQLLGSGLLSVGHAKVILGVDGEEDRIRLARESVRDGLTVRMLEVRINRRRTPARRREVTPDIPDDHLALLQDRLLQRFGTNVRLTPSVRYPNGRRGRGRIEIDFTDNEDLSRILDLLGVDVNAL